MLGNQKMENDIYMLGVQNKQMLINKILKILIREPLNIIYTVIGSDWNILFVSDTDTQKDCYKNLHPESYSWPCVIADSTSGKMLKLRLKPERELSKILDKLIKLNG